MKKNKKIKVIAGLCALTVVVGTFAFFNATTTIENPFATAKYGGETIEKFTPDYKWEPGGQITKEVQAKNTGDYPLYVRVKFDEKWERNGAVFVSFSSSNQSLFFPENANKSIENGSSVYKHLKGVEDGSWVKKEDGYFYYKTALNPKDETNSGITSILMDYVTLCNDADMGTYTTTGMKYALVDASKNASDLTDADYNLSAAPAEIPEGKVLYQKKLITLDESDAGLADADYTLTITTEFVQANEDAANGLGWTYVPVIG